MAARKILAILESRATYGYSKNVMQVLATRPALELMTLVTGMHLMPELGSSVRLIEEDGFPISTRVPLAPEDDTASAWPKTMGKAMAGFAEAMGELEPDIVLLFGDRAETFMACIAASYMSVPTAHIQAGDKSGHVDDIARMALAKLVNIHFPSCEDSAERLRRLGEQEFRIHNVGAPQLDNIVGTDFSTDAISIDATDHDLSKPYILVVQHSVLVERGEIGAQIQSTIDAVNGVHMPVFWIYPNSDAGFREIIARLEEADSGGRIKFVQNVERNKFLSLLANCAVLVGNSSSGILEAPSFKIPVV
ncbi:MAG: UDP-N-acetylglucosamine 2-epimerase, partial [Rhodospirillales bacterium]|nr:UDP-N-acetylglucosamine 2-epimerase [Rhodospirillales bacterium]